MQKNSPKRELGLTGPKTVLSRRRAIDPKNDASETPLSSLSGRCQGEALSRQGENQMVFATGLVGLFLSIMGYSSKLKSVVPMSYAKGHDIGTTTKVSWR